MKINGKTYTALDFHSRYRLEEIFAQLIMDDEKYDETFKTYMGYNRPFDVNPSSCWIKKNLFTPTYEIRIHLNIKYDVKQYFMTQLRRKLYKVYGIKVLRKYPYSINLTYNQTHTLVNLLKLQGEI